MTIPPALAGPLAARIPGLISAANELSSFGEADPAFARECGVELGCMEARLILLGGAPSRVEAAMNGAVRLGQPAAIEVVDWDAVNRLEKVVASGLSQMDLKKASLEAEASQEGLAKIGSFMGLATGAVGLFKSFF